MIPDLFFLTAFLGAACAALAVAFAVSGTRAGRAWAWVFGVLGIGLLAPTGLWTYIFFGS